jgi:hypothetical protein
MNLTNEVLQSLEGETSIQNSKQLITMVVSQMLQVELS